MFHSWVVPCDGSALFPPRFPFRFLSHGCVEELSRSLVTRPKRCSFQGSAARYALRTRIIRV